MAAPSSAQEDASKLVQLLSNDEGLSPVVARVSQVELGGQIGSATIFTYFWKGDYYRETLEAAHIWVTGMLVERGAPDLLPSWATTATVLVEVDDMPISLDRNRLSRASEEFRLLRDAIARELIVTFQEMSQKDNFAREVWGSMRGTTLPSAFRALASPRREDSWNSVYAREFFTQCGPLIPLRAFKHNQRRQGFYGVTVTLTEIEAAARASGVVAEGAPCPIHYLENVGPESSVNHNQLPGGVYVDARKISDSDTEGKTISSFLEAMVEVAPARFSLAPINEMPGEDVDQPHQGWTALKAMFERTAVYDSAESYDVEIRSYTPTPIPVIVIEMNLKDEDVSKVNATLDELLRQSPQLASRVNDMKSRLSKGNSVRTMLLNYDNPLLHQMAEMVREDPIWETRPEFRATVSNMIENARIDFYGGARIGHHAQVSIYHSVREPLLMDYLSWAKSGVKYIDVPERIEQRHGVVIMGDLSGSTQKMLPVDNESWGKILQSYSLLVSEWLFDVSGGRAFVDRFEGDGFTAFWMTDPEPARLSVELTDIYNSVKRLLGALETWSARLEIRSALADASVTADLSSRIALAYGPLQFGMFGKRPSAVGRTVALAARMLVSKNAYWIERPDHRMVIDSVLADKGSGFGNGGRWFTDRLYRFKDDQRLRDFLNVEHVYTE